MTDEDKIFFAQLSNKLDDIHERMTIQRAINAWQHILDRRKSIRKHNSLNDIVFIEYDRRCTEYPTVQRYCIVSEATPEIAASYHVDGDIKAAYKQGCGTIHIAAIHLRLKQLEDLINNPEVNDD